ncbi:hypothetical protein NQ036_00945 [Brevibacterium sp. 91QC2O2]|jgi:hypothetical protein|uniref:hypothetical protein n=1 Tax=Brevibacterium TaxID=1696 RepID=UPI00211B7FA5|nr:MULTISPECIES: hypothetical protein [unclassified Brevibacterium]MCQ9366816.1 hypothetical protein [Brevibacterium sp. 91QC2O2]MCQ9383966.1 hypothetical protein [Brevibacterium sp. 68QC2CO]
MSPIPPEPLEPDAVYDPPAVAGSARSARADDRRARSKERVERTVEGLDEIAEAAADLAAEARRLHRPEDTRLQYAARLTGRGIRAARKLFKP